MPIEVVAVQLIVKVDVSLVSNPVSHVATVIAAAAADDAATVEEVFEGLRSGRSAGLLSVSLHVASGSAAYRAIVRALRTDAAVSYVEEPKPRQARDTKNAAR